MVDVRQRIVGEPDRPGPFVAVEPGGEQVPIGAVGLGFRVIDLLRPDEPGLALAVYGDLRSPNIARSAGDGKGGVPDGAGESAGVDFLPQPAIGRPDGPDIAV